MPQLGENVQLGLREVKYIESDESGKVWLAWLASENMPFTGLITLDDKKNIVEIERIIVGYDKESELLKISQLNSNSDISAGDKVTTGGLGNFNVKDIPVGEVVATTHSSDYLTKEVTVKLSADTKNLHVVELVGN